HPFAMNPATMMMFTIASGKNTFHPILIRMSYFSRGIVQRTHTKTNIRNPTFSRNERNERRKPPNVAGSLYQGMSHPPRKRVVRRADIVNIDMYSPMKKSANFIDEYSV